MATQPLFVNKRSKIQVEDGFEVQITNEVELFKLVDDVPTSIRKLPVGTKSSLMRRKPGRCSNEESNSFTCRPK